MKPTLKWLFMFGTLNVFCSLMPSSTISAKLGCTHPAMQITRIGTEQQYTQDSNSQYCYYVYERFHASCSTCGYDTYYNEPSFYAANHNWKTIVKETDTYCITRKYCVNFGCNCDTGEMIRPKKVPVVQEIQ